MTVFDAVMILFPERTGMPENLDAAAVQSAFRQRSKEVHPDVGGRAEDFIRLKEAHQTAMAWCMRPPAPSGFMGLAISMDFENGEISMAEGFGLEDFQEQWSSLRHRKPRKPKK